MPVPVYKQALRVILLILAALVCGLPGTSLRAAEMPLTIVALGDSLTAGYLLGPGEGFASQLRNALAASGHKDVVIVDAGVSGDTSSGGLARLDWAVGPKAGAVILELGANDALRGIDPQITRANLQAIIARLKARGLPVLLAGMRAPPNMGAQYAAAFDGIYPELAAANGLIFYPFFLDGVAAQPGLVLQDGMHPNAEGVALVVARILPKVEELIGAARKAHEAKR